MIKVSGFSDDFIEIEGAVDEEIASFDKDTYIEFDDGTILRMAYISGIWKAFLQKGTAGVTILRLRDRAGDDYTDLVMIETDRIRKIWQTHNNEDLTLLRSDCVKGCCE